MTDTIKVRPAPTPEQQAAAAARIAEVEFIGAAHAHRLLSILNAHQEKAA